MALDVLPPRSPKLIGFVGRRNGTVRREFREREDSELHLRTLQPALRDWETQYQATRPLQALGYLAPHQFLASLNSHMS